MHPRAETARRSVDAGHDACGVGFIARVAGEAGRDIVALGLDALRRLAHRGAHPALGAVDGCGVLTAIPWRLVDDTIGARLPASRTRAVGMLFVDGGDLGRTAELVDRELGKAGARRVVWRDVPIDRASVLPAQRAGTPSIFQVVAGFDAARHSVDAALYRARLRIQHEARTLGLRLTIASLSTQTIVYKALVTPDALPRFYPDLADARFTSAFITFHQRFSTNTSADWSLAQPFRTLAHNGEINTIGGNRLWMRARVADATSMPPFGDERPISDAGSDSQSLDDAIELMRYGGYSIAHALTRLVPPAWERDRDLPPDIRAFHEFQALLSEPWDGPSALVFADGRYVGAALDRNGFRPARVVTTASGLVAVASEVGVLPADEHEIVDRARLGPGDMLVVDMKRGAVATTQEIRRRLALRRRYRRLVDAVVRPLAWVAEPASAERPIVSTPVELLRRQTAFGCSREEIELLLKPMAADAHEAVGSMGDDTPPAVLSSRPRLLADFFRQRFAQVTNPPVDPCREASVMSLTTSIGGHGNFVDELASRPTRVVLRSPVLSREQLAQLGAARALAPKTIALVMPADGAAVDALDGSLRAIVDQACAAVADGSALLILSDREIDAGRAPVPAVLATAAVHHALIARGLRMRASVVVDTGDARDAHQVALLCAYGASAVCPWLGLDTIAAVAGVDPTGCDAAVARYRLALERGLRTLMSKMGVCTFSGYCGAQLFEILGLDESVAARFFPGTPSPIGGATLADIAAAIVGRHRRAFQVSAPIPEYPGLHGYRRGGEYHATNPLVVRGLQRARGDESGDDPAAAAGETGYQVFTSHVYGRPPAAVRDLVDFKPAHAISLDAVEPASAICRRFFASAMSVGALSPEAHRTIAAAMNRLGARSNSGEGGEERDRFGAPDGSRTRQVASARFGVTPAYLRSADELQIKIAQGSKPGEGGQLPGIKVVPHIARLRHAQPGTTLISPPVHHDIYSIEDLAELIYDLRALHPRARMNVKLVASAGVGIIATGVAKAGADAIQISGHDGGTGASPRGSIKHAGMPWEIGLSEAHHALVGAGLRSRVVLQTDGGIKTGRDIAIAAALGADEYGFGTAALVAIGCVMARQCHANTCPVGIATQRDDLRAGYSGTADMLIGYLTLVAEEVRQILASLGIARLASLIGRADLLTRRPNVTPSVNLDGLLAAADTRRCRSAISDADAVSPEALAAMEPPLPAVVGPAHPLTFSGAIANTDRAFGTRIAGAIAERHGDAGLPDGSVQMTVTGSAGQSFGAFALPGMRLALIGDANDGVGKGMHGGDIVVAPAARERGRARQVIVGNAALYGATGGRAFIAGAAGERFAIRNSGAIAVVEGVGDHACEYMTGGAVVVLGPVGRNFAAGMTGGAAYVWLAPGEVAPRTHPEQLAIDVPSAAEQKLLRDLIETHERLTGSRVARAILRTDRLLASFCKVTPAQVAAAAAEVAEAAAVNQ